MLNDETVKVWNIERWPTTSPEALSALDRIKSTHRVIPIPAFVRSLPRGFEESDTPSPAEWSLVKPDAYAHELPGSIVLATFHLMHYVMGDSEYWNAVPDTIRLLTVKEDSEWFDANTSPLKRANADLIFGSPSPSPSKKTKKH
jgi:hypothetical protein